MSPEIRKAYDAVLIYSSRDRAAVDSIANWLTSNAGLNIFRDRASLNPGDPIHENLEKAIRGAGCLIIFLGPDSVGRWQTDEAHAFLQGVLRGSRVPLLPVLLPGMAAEIKAQIPLFFRRRIWIEFDREPTELGILERIAETVRRASALTPAPEEAAVTPGAAPYRGLAAYREEDSAWFRGRDSLIQQALLRLRSTRFLALAGMSGSGKTSLVTAGLLPELRLQGWPCAVVHPRSEPVVELARALWGLQGESVRWSLGEILEHLRQAGAPILGVLADQILDDLGAERMLLVLDPFESVFDPRVQPAERSRLFKVLATAAEAVEGRLHTLAVLDSQSIGLCAADPDLNALVTEHLLQVGVLAGEELLAAALEPAREAGLTWEAGLPARLEQDAGAGLADLTPLSVAMSEVFARRTERVGRQTLTLDAYASIGGLGGALAFLAERELEEARSRLGEEGVNAVRNMFVFHLIDPNAEGPGVLRTAPIAELAQTGRSPAEMEHVVEQWIEAGLLTRVRESKRPVGDLRGRGAARALAERTDQEPAGARVSREALLRYWPRLRNWIREGRDDARAAVAVREEALRWAAGGRPRSGLLTGARLLDVEDLAARQPGAFTDVAREYLQASLDARADSPREREEALKRALAEERTRIAKLEQAREAAEERLRAEAQAREEAEALARRNADRLESAESAARWLKLALVVALGLAIAAGYAGRAGFFNF
jgi:hypothetical protein